MVAKAGSVFAVARAHILAKCMEAAFVKLVDLAKFYATIIMVDARSFGE